MNIQQGGVGLSQGRQRQVYLNKAERKEKQGKERKAKLIELLHGREHNPLLTPNASVTWRPVCLNLHGMGTEFLSRQDLGKPEHWMVLDYVLRTYQSPIKEIFR